MSYQELTVVKAVKAGLTDALSRRVVWDDTTYGSGMKYANDGKTILYAISKHTIDEGNATWNTTHEVGTYSALLEKTGGTDIDSSVHLQFTPDYEVLTLADLQTAIDAGTPGSLDPVWGFWYRNLAPVVGNFAQVELYFEDPISEGWLEVTILPCQGLTGDDTFTNRLLASTDIAGFGGNTPDGSSVFVWPPVGTIVDLDDKVLAAWIAAQPGTSAAAYELKRVRIELWEANLARTCHIDDVVINDHTYAVEPGLAGVELGPNSDYVALNFVEVRDRFGRLEVLAPILGAEQELCVGPLLPELFNDSAGYARFKPMWVSPPAPSAVAATGVDFTYVAIQVTDPS